MNFANYDSYYVVVDRNCEISTDSSRKSSGKTEHVLEKVCEKYFI